GIRREICRVAWQKDQRSDLLCRRCREDNLRNRRASNETLRSTRLGKEIGCGGKCQGEDTLAQCGETVPPMTAQENVEIMDVPAGRRQELDWILEESFEGWYLWHSKKTLRDVELVRAAMSSGRPLGLVMLKSLEGTVGYVYYIAVARASRNKG